MNIVAPFAKSKWSLVSIVSVVYLLFAFAPARAADTVVSLNVPRAPIYGTGAVTQRFIMFDLAEIPTTVTNPIDARGVLVLFTGGNGKLGLGDNELNILQTNFLVRSRHAFASQGFHVAVMDAATDFLARPEGLWYDRTSPEHTQDIATVMEYLRGRFPGLPIWLVGTSRGSISAANAAAVLTGDAAPDGIVLTSPITQDAIDNPESLNDVQLTAITVPAFIGVHRSDTCYVTPPEAAKGLIDTLHQQNSLSQVIAFEGGFPLLDEPCSPLAPHGFFGIETRVVASIGNFIHSFEETESDDTTTISTVSQWLARHNPLRALAMKRVNLLSYLF